MIKLTMTGQDAGETIKASWLSRGQICSAPISQQCSTNNGVGLGSRLGEKWEVSKAPVISCLSGQPGVKERCNYLLLKCTLNSWRSMDGALSAGASIISWRGGDSTINKECNSGV